MAITIEEIIQMTLNLMRTIGELERDLKAAKTSIAELEIKIGKPLKNESKE